MNTDMNQTYEHIDLCACYEPIIDVPSYLLEQWQDSDGKASPFACTVAKEIGGTVYQVETECGGGEHLSHKLKRLIFSDSEVSCR